MPLFQERSIKLFAFSNIRIYLPKNDFSESSFNLLQSRFFSFLCKFFIFSCKFCFTKSIKQSPFLGRYHFLSYFEKFVKQKMKNFFAVMYH